MASYAATGTAAAMARAVFSMHNIWRDAIARDQADAGMVRVSAAAADATNIRWRTRIFRLVEPFAS